MPIRSMTGYGREVSTRDGWSVTAEMRSVNHRGLDTRVSGATLAGATGMAIRVRIKKQCHRGRVECRIELEAPPHESLPPDALNNARELYETLESVRSALGIEEPLSMSDLLAAGLQRLTLAEAEVAPPDDLILSTVEKAIRSLVASRDVEGATLQRELTARLDHIRELVEEIDRLSGEAVQEYRRRLLARVNEALDQASAGQIDPDRLLQEIVIHVDKADITEEIVRARSHTTEIGKLLDTSDPAAASLGKRIDFFLQELNREANTMASKSHSAQLTSQVVEVKAEIERLREQTQNIE
jgi:uncharacterized protein (TIGR00255 family)